MIYYDQTDYSRHEKQTLQKPHLMPLFMENN